MPLMNEEVMERQKRSSRNVLLFPFCLLICFCFRFILFCFSFVLINILICIFGVLFPIFIMSLIFL